nr:hypothetical protein [Rickettsia endosymbiont of Ceutorhynchus assimilis]
MPLRAMQQTFIFVGNSKLLAGSRDTANESRYDGSRRHDDKLVIPLLVSG